MGISYLFAINKSIVCIDSRLILKSYAEGITPLLESNHFKI
jgi:hypothetical protein